MALVKPTEVVLWAVGGDKVSPSLGKRDDGWVFGEKPGHDHMNFIQNNFGLWLDYVNKLGTFENTASSGFTFGSLGWGEDLNDVEGSVIIGNKSAQGSHAETILIGHKSLQNATNSQKSIVIGNNSGNDPNTQGVIIGSNSEAGFKSVLIGGGDAAGLSTSVIVGIGAGDGKTGTENVILGNFSTNGSGSVSKTVVVGHQAGRGLNADRSVIMGHYPGDQSKEPVDGDDNVFIGSNAGSIFNTPTNKTIGIGSGALDGGGPQVEGTIAIGYQVGGSAYSYGVDAMLLIGFGNTAAPLVEGNITQSQFKINGDILSTGQFVLPSYSVAGVPAGITGGFIYITDETGGPVPAFFDGTDWRRVTDRAVIS